MQIRNLHYYYYTEEEYFKAAEKLTFASTDEHK